MKDYVEERDGGFWIAGKRISLNSVVYAFRRGAAPESIARSFQLLTFEEIYGAITFYLANQKRIDEYLMKEEIETEQLHQALLESHSDWREKMRKAKQELLTSHCKNRF